MEKIYPSKLHQGDQMRVIAPADAHPLWNQSVKDLAHQRLVDFGLVVTYGKHTDEIDVLEISSLESRVQDFHDAFLDPEVKAVIASDGGWNSNQMLSYIDWDIIKNNPKIFCGLSDITSLTNAIYAKTGLVTYSGPTYGHFGKKHVQDYMLDYFKTCLFDADSYPILASKEWSNDGWEDEDNRTFIPNQGYLVINEGEAEGTSLGGNQCTLNLLQGTQYMPDLNDSILFLEDDSEVQPKTFDRDLQSLLHLPTFSGVRGIIIGRFEKASHMSDDILKEIIKRKKELEHLPVIANVDFGHTDPKITFPVGGVVSMRVSSSGSSINVLQH